MIVQGSSAARVLCSGGINMPSQCDMDTEAAPQSRWPAAARADMLGSCFPSCAARLSVIRCCSSLGQLGAHPAVPLPLRHVPCACALCIAAC